MTSRKNEEFLQIGNLMVEMLSLNIGGEMRVLLFGRK